MYINPEGFFDYETVKNGHSLIPEKYAEYFNSTELDLKQYQRICSIVLIVLSVVGCIGNVLVCYVVVSNKHMRTSINLCLLSQAISDTMFLLAFLYSVIYCMTLLRIFTKTTLNVEICRLAHYLSYRASTFVKMNIAYDRYIAICHPLTSFSKNSRQKTIRDIIAIWIFSFFLSIVHVVMLSIPNYATTFWYELYFDLESLIVAAIPIAFIAVLYTLIGFKIWKSSRLFKHSSSKTNSENENRYKTNGIDISVIVILEYVTCWTPKAAIMLLCAFKFLDETGTIVKSFMIPAFAILFLSLVVNPILYSLMCYKFRKAFKDLLCCSGYHRCDVDEG